MESNITETMYRRYIATLKYNISRHLTEKNIDVHKLDIDGFIHHYCFPSFIEDPAEIEINIRSLWGLSKYLGINVSDLVEEPEDYGFLDLIVFLQEYKEKSGFSSEELLDSCKTVINLIDT